MTTKIMEAGQNIVKLLNAVVATGTGDEWGLRKTATNHTIHAKGSADISAVTISLEGSINGVDYFDLGTHVFTAGEITADEAMFHVVSRPVNYVRANLTVLTGTSMTAHYTPGV